MLNCNKRGGISFYIGDNKAEKPRPLFSLVAIASTNSCPSQDILSTPTNKRILPASHRYPKRAKMPSAQSPSPPPSAPTALTPGARATAFQTLYAKALSNTLHSISYSSFAACFPSIAVAAPDSLKSLHANFIQRLSDFASVCRPFVTHI